MSYLSSRNRSVLMDPRTRARAQFVSTFGRESHHTVSVVFKIFYQWILLKNRYSITINPIDTPDNPKNLAFAICEMAGHFFMKGKVGFDKNLYAKWKKMQNSFQLFQFYTSFSLFQDEQMLSEISEEEIIELSKHSRHDATQMDKFKADITALFS